MSVELVESEFFFVLTGSSVEDGEKGGLDLFFGQFVFQDFAEDE